MKNPLHKHEFETSILSGFTVAKQYRKCNCGYEETLLEDASTHELKWVEGCYVAGEGSKYIFVFANTEASYVDAVKNILGSLPEEQRGNFECVWASDYLVWEMIRNEPNPAFFLADDWYEMDLIQSPQFKMLMCVRYIR